MKSCSPYFIPSVSYSTGHDFLFNDVVSPVLNQAQRQTVVNNFSAYANAALKANKWLRDEYASKSTPQYYMQVMQDKVYQQWTTASHTDPTNVLPIMNNTVNESATTDIMALQTNKIKLKAKDISGVTFLVNGPDRTAHAVIGCKGDDYNCQKGIEYYGSELEPQDINYCIDEIPKTQVKVRSFCENTKISTTEIANTIIKSSYPIKLPNSLTESAELNKAQEVFKGHTLTAEDFYIKYYDKEDATTRNVKQSVIDSELKLSIPKQTPKRLLYVKLDYTKNGKHFEKKYTVEDGKSKYTTFNNTTKKYKFKLEAIQANFVKEAKSNNVEVNPKDIEIQYYFECKEEKTLNLPARQFCILPDGTQYQLADIGNINPQFADDKPDTMDPNSETPPDPTNPPLDYPPTSGLVFVPNNPSSKDLHIRGV